MSIGSRIKQVRKEAEMTQEQFAEAIGMKQSPLSQIEGDKILPSIETLKIIIRKFNTTYDFVIDGSDKESGLSVLPEGISEDVYRKLGINSRSLISQLVNIVNAHKPNDVQVNTIFELEAFIQDIIDKRIGKLESIMKKLLSTVDQKIFEDEIKDEISKSDERLSSKKKE